MLCISFIDLFGNKYFVHFYYCFIALSKTHFSTLYECEKFPFIVVLLTLLSKFDLQPDD